MVSDGLRAVCALRICVSMSAIGSVILMAVSLPAGLAQTRDLTAHRGLAQLRARQTELAVVAVRPARQRATVAQPNGVRIARQLLQLLLRVDARVFGGLRVADLLLELGTFGRIPLDRGFAMTLAHDHRFLGH